MTPRSSLGLLLLLLLPALALAQDPSPAPSPTGPSEEEVKELEERLTQTETVRPAVDKDGAVTLSYPLLERKEASDFEAKGLDKFGVEKCEVVGRDPITGLEVGAGSRGAGLVLHELTWLGDFEVRLKVQLLVSPQSATMCLLLGKKVGVLWGQRLVKPSNLRPLTKNGKLDRNAFKEGRLVELVVKREGAKLTVTCDGVKTDEAELTKGELEGGLRLGLMARNVRFVIKDWTLKGKVDPKKLPK
ncbi:MAG: hypothetical protein AB7N76_23710 [Planctomycetota bacterium]